MILYETRFYIAPYNKLTKCYHHPKKSGYPKISYKCQRLYNVTRIWTLQLLLNLKLTQLGLVSWICMFTSHLTMLWSSALAVYFPFTSAA